MVRLWLAAAICVASCLVAYPCVAGADGDFVKMASPGLAVSVRGVYLSVRPSSWLTRCCSCHCLPHCIQVDRTTGMYSISLDGDTWFEASSTAYSYRNGSHLYTSAAGGGITLSDVNVYVGSAVATSHQSLSACVTFFFCLVHGCWVVLLPCAC